MNNYNEVQEGDLVRMTRGEVSHQGRVIANPLDWIIEFGYSQDYYKQKGWTVEILEKVQRPLPTRPGMYASGDEWFRNVLRLDTEGCWWVEGDIDQSGIVQYQHNHYGLNRLVTMGSVGGE